MCGLLLAMYNMCVFFSIAIEQIQYFFSPAVTNRDPTESRPKGYQYYMYMYLLAKVCQNTCTIGINDASHLPRLDSSRTTLHPVPSFLVYVSLRKVEVVLA